MGGTNLCELSHGLRLEFPLGRCVLGCASIRLDRTYRVSVLAFLCVSRAKAGISALVDCIALCNSNLLCGALPTEKLELRDVI